MAYTDENGQELSWEARGNLIGAPPVRDRGDTPGSGMPPNRGIVEDEAVFQERRAAAEASLAGQRQRAEAMLNEGYGKLDNRYWFSKVYSLVTENEILEADRGTFFYPSYVMQSVRYFEKLYEDNINAEDNGGVVEEHWAEAFRVASDEDLEWADILDVATAGLYRQVLSLVVSMQAHIRYDLPRAEAWVFQSYYAHMEDAKLSDFAEDFNSMMGVFERAGAVMNDEINNHNIANMGTALPRRLQDMAMDMWFDADMGTERADTWQRSQALVDEGLIGPDPYSEGEGHELQGDATLVDNMSNLQQISDPNLRPSMEGSAEIESDSEIRNDLASKTDAEIAQMDVGTRIRQIRRMLSGFAWNEDENTIIRVVRVSNDIVTLIDGANAWDMLVKMNGPQYTTLRELFRESYYGSMTFAVAATYLRRCMDGYTTEWEESMILDILEAHPERRKLITHIGDLYEGSGYQGGLLYLQGQLDWGDETRLNNLFGESTISSGDAAIRDRVSSAGENEIESLSVEQRVNMINRLMRGWTGDEDEQTMMSILQASQRAGDVVAVIDSVSAHKMAKEVHGAEWRQLKAFFQSSYYPSMSNSSAFRLIVTCINGHTAGWEEEMVADIILLRNDGRRLITQIGQYYESGSFNDGLNKLEWQLSGRQQDRIENAYGTSGSWW